MNTNLKTSYIKFELLNGDVVNLGISFAKLKLLKSVNADLYQDWLDFSNGKKNEVIDLPTFVYIAYWCFNYGGLEPLMNQEQFESLVPFDIALLKRTFNLLMYPKKKRNSETRS